MTDVDTLMTQYKLFHKYWYQGAEKQNLKDFQTADQLRLKIVPQIEALVDEDNRTVCAEMYSDFAEFLFEYLSCLSSLGRDPTGPQYNMKSMAERSVQLDPNIFYGYYFLTIFHSWNLKPIHSGSTPAVYKGEDAATSIVGTALNLFVKGVTLGATATASGISKSAFNTSIQNMIAAYQRNISRVPVDAQHYMKMTSRMFHMAEYCEDVGNKIWRDIYLAIKAFGVDRLDYSSLEAEDISDAQEAVMEFWVVADSKV